MSLRNLSNGMPSVTFNFEGAKKLDGRITFTRASYAPANDPASGTGTSGGTLQEFNVNVPRLTDQGLLIEESRTNILPRSNEFDFDDGTNASYRLQTGGGGTTPTLTPTYTTAPDGTNTAWRLQCSVASGTASTDYSRLRGPYIGSAVPVNGSIYVKSNTGADQDLAFGINGSNNGNLFTATPEWTRIDINWTVNPNMRIGLAGDITGPGTLDISIWGAQHEAGTFPTSYIPTSGAQVTRAADLCEITGTNFSSWYTQNEWTVTNSFNMIGSSNAAPNVASFFPDAGGDAVLTAAPANGSMQHFWLGGPSGTSILDYISQLPPSTTNTDSKAAVNFVQQSTGQGACNGVLASSLSAPPSTKQLISRLGFGQRSRGITNTNGYIKGFSFYPTHVPDSALRGLTYS